MHFSDLVLIIFFLAQTGIGLLGNSTLLVVFISAIISQPHRKKSMDLILTHLTVANTVILLTQAAPGMVMTFRLETFVDNIGCQIVLYIRRVARGLSICTTCLLSVFQAVTISPYNSWWAQLKPRCPGCILPSFLFFWVINMLVDVNFLKPVAVTKNVTITVNDYSRKSCFSTLWVIFFHEVFFLSAMTLRDIFFVFLMSWASGYMVIVLHRHRKQVQHIHSSSQTQKFSPESRATQTILLLVSCFVCFYCFNSSIVLLNYVDEKDLILYDVAMFLGSGYAFFCPLVLISRDPRVPRPQCGSKKTRGLSVAIHPCVELQSSSLSISLPIDLM
uniref:vomeronasal 1 receptor ornAnaV1R3185 n=1 Tax=Ornithorhynchus anatinus TaxID=9258 RepID=UPI00015561A5|nr:vomeronasal 1 receptor ornAnaV1R3185 [Ornithorhynchus anatinus]